MTGLPVAELSRALHDDDCGCDNPTEPYYDHLAEVAATHITNTTPAGHCPTCGCNADTLIHGIGRALAAWRGEHNLNQALTARIQHLTSRDDK